MILLTYKRVEDSPSKIGNMLGFKSQQIARELYEENGIIAEELVEKSDRFLKLSEKGKSDPLIAVMMDT